MCVFCCFQETIYFLKLPHLNHTEEQVVYTKKKSVFFGKKNVDTTSGVDKSEMSPTCVYLYFGEDFPNTHPV